MQVAGRTNDAAGDGTTTASVLARDLIHYGLQVSLSSCSVFQKAPLLHAAANNIQPAEAVASQGHVCFRKNLI